MTPLERAINALASSQELDGDEAAKATILAYLDAVIEEYGDPYNVLRVERDKVAQ